MRVEKKSTFFFFDRNHVLGHPKNHLPSKGGAWLACANALHPVWNYKDGEVLPCTVLEVFRLVEQVGEGIPRRRAPRVDAHSKHLGCQRPGQRLLPWCWGGGILRRLSEAILAGEHMRAGTAPNNGRAKSPCPYQVSGTVPQSKPRSATKKGKADN